MEKSVKYGVEYIYEKYGRVAIEKEILTDQVAFWKNCYERLKNEADAEIKRLQEELEAVETSAKTRKKAGY